MDWIQNNIANILIGAFIAWVLWKRFIAPRLFGVKSISAANYHNFSKQEHTLLDVRSFREWQSGYPRSAIHIDLGSINSRMHELPKDKPLLVICASGNRSAIAATKLAQSGFEEVYNFSGGMGAWKAAGLPTTKAS